MDEPKLLGSFRKSISAVTVSQRKKHPLSPNCPKRHIFHPKGKAERCGFPHVLHFLLEEWGLAGSLLA